MIDEKSDGPETTEGTRVCVCLHIHTSLLLLLHESI